MFDCSWFCRKGVGWEVQLGLKCSWFPWENGRHLRMMKVVPPAALVLAPCCLDKRLPGASKYFVQHEVESFAHTVSALICPEW